MEGVAELMPELFVDVEIVAWALLHRHAQEEGAIADAGVSSARDKSVETALGVGADHHAPRRCLGAFVGREELIGDSQLRMHGQCETDCLGQVAGVRFGCDEEVSVGNLNPVVLCVNGFAFCIEESQ